MIITINTMETAYFQLNHGNFLTMQFIITYSCFLTSVHIKQSATVIACEMSTYLCELKFMGGYVGNQFIPQAGMPIFRWLLIKLWMTGCK